MPDIDWKQYYADVLTDFRELKDSYPFSYLTILPTVKPGPAAIRVVAANKALIEMTCSVESDFTDDYSRELHIEIPVNYRKNGCKVYGARWVDLKKFEDKDIHFYNRVKPHPFGYELCIGTPESFPMMKNVILENVKTAENMLIAYERVMTGGSDCLELIAYAHGEKGRKQFLQNRVKYLPGGSADVKTKEAKT